MEKKQKHIKDKKKKTSTNQKAARQTAQAPGRRIAHAKSRVVSRRQASSTEMEGNSERERGGDDSEVSDSPDSNEHPSSAQKPISNTESDSDLSQISLRMSPASLYKAARNAQIAANAAKEEAKTMRRKYDDAMNEVHQDESVERGSKKEKKTKSSRDDDTHHEQVIKGLGHQFEITHALWLHEPTKTFQTTIDDEYDKLDRFGSTAAKVQGQLRDILDIVPATYHGDLPNHWLGRSNSGQTQLLVFDLEFSEDIGRVENANGTSTYHPWNVSVLHRDYKGRFDIQTVFLNPILQKTMSCIIRGPASVIAMNEGESSRAARNNETMDLKWGLNHTTPGMVAASAVLARWALSPDECLKEKGNESGIRWHDDFDNYLEYLLSGLQKQKKSVLNIFREWDQVLFPNTSHGLAGQLSNTDRDQLMQSVMAALNHDEDGYEQPEGHNSHSERGSGGLNEGGNSEDGSDNFEE
ncbi:hypothetical protein SERLADRAFT_443304 [Serpula lacrymans var. lacrymans S7.9]|uniref:Uncharacterized protein n=1 Tax=Serpula lacrymans var. lacrymans (strain S7.9) TaxID=578457 RepID=F8PC57_SERL9|nr:uncharacterized protein SERLADRAFT_443304 [Serpula lacrymans var. lacrymans S7.9]EGO19257.1 hypothetical protein SERLADRAFT_443304 [Serpula lacrymans var. lacrymans S7.9]